MKLADQVSQWLDVEIKKPSSPIGRNDWIYGVEGKIYVRYNAHLDRIDLATFDIDEEYQRQGVAKGIIAMAVKKKVRTTRIENILNTEWADKVVQYKFKGRETVVNREGYGVTVDFRSLL